MKASNHLVAVLLCSSYLSMEYSDFQGFPALLTNGRVNEKGVAVRDVWADNREELIAMTPNPQGELQYSTFHVSYSSARLLRADYDGNSHLIADVNEGWVVWEMSGSQKLWAAERLGDDHVRVLYPGYVVKFPLNFANNPDYMCSPKIVSFTIEQDWCEPNGTEAFSVLNVYGVQGPNFTARDGGFRYLSQAALENTTWAMAPVTEKDLIACVRDHRISDDEAGYGQVVSLYPNTHPDLLRIWVALTSSVTAPWWLGVKSASPDYGQLRYLAKNAASAFLDTDFRFQEATHFAGRTFKQVLYYTVEVSSNTTR